MKQHLAEIASSQPVGRLHRNEAAFDRALLHALVIDPASIIFHFNINVIEVEDDGRGIDRKSTRLNSSLANISYAVFCLKKNNKVINHTAGLDSSLFDNWYLTAGLRGRVLIVDFVLAGLSRDEGFEC